ncbi:unnamed protein product [Dracunculus medinensis]|uniref:FERM domain-containing protein n=1 Tax=Dracunculus medinensis TaxID=318479 RepID=A0A3P7PHN3_DRAME|nr:unnamed protein product [Dracunculus medinensis]
MPHRISGRKSSERHLKRKKKITLHRVEQTDVVIELLNGKRIEVSCRSDAIAFEVADVVMRHMNYTENSFFGLTVLKDGEHFFLDDHQRLEKFAPPGWRNARQLAPKSIYILYLRFRYYPASLDFIKTNIVLHELYLQLRRDFLDDNIQPPREKVFEMAALALQAEFSDRSNTSIIDYFNIEYYLPKRYIDNNNLKRMVTVLAEFHSQYKGVTNQQAEIQFILACQNLSDYGAHLHRVFKSKPSYNLGNTPFGDPQTGIANWIGILTRGIIECEEQSGRRIINEHLWQNTQTLQFDKKRFVIVSEKVTPLRSVFFTDHYTKFIHLFFYLFCYFPIFLAYFVRFAASQHRFMIKMRQWKQTLRPGDSKYMQQALLNVEKTENVQLESLTKRDRFIPLLVESECPSTNAKETESRQFDAEGNSIVEAVENGDGYKFEVILEKDSRMGLGLTLVDGNLNGIKGVYVKSVIEGGAGMNGGILVGDRLLSINDISLKEKDRHAAVDLVKESGNRVRLVFTFLFLQNVFMFSFVYLVNRSRTPPVQKKRADIPKKRIRAVSDFGAVGDNLPELNSEEILQQNNIRNTSKASCNLDGLENDLDWDEIIANSSYTSDFNDNYDMRYPVLLDNVDGQSNDFSRITFVHLNRNESGNLGVQIASSGGSVYIKQLTANPALSHPNIRIGDKLIMVNGQKTQNLTHQQVVDLLRNSGNAVVLGLAHPETQNNDLLDDKEEIIRVVLDKSPTGSLGLSLAKKTGLEGIFIRTIGVGSAADVDGTLRVGDKFWEINGQSVNNLTPGAVVKMLKSSSNPIEIVVKRSVS